MADAAGTTVVDASYPFEENLLKTWVKAAAGKLKLVYVDREDDPAVFLEIDTEHDKDVRVLAQQMAQNIRPGGTGRLHVEPHRFKPRSLPAVLKNSEVSLGGVKARNILQDPNAPSDLRAMAEEMLRLSRYSSLRMSINADNLLIRGLAGLVARRPEAPTS